MTIGDWTEERLADRAGPAVRGPAVGAETTPRAGLRGERVMPHRPHPAPPGVEPVPVRTCWMCGIRLPAEQMMPDGGSACPDLRWYCRDTWGCTGRWTTHSARLAAIRPDPAGASQSSGGPVAGQGATRAVAV
jgi:hypothetical protein